MNTYLKKFIEGKFKKPGKALDLGAGDFADVNFLEKLSWECEGVDIKTGINLEEYFLSKKRPFDLVFSNYLVQKIKNQQQFAKIIFDNLKEEGWFFIHTFDKTDKNSGSDLTEDYLRKILLKQGFRNIETKVFSYYDDEAGHKHWHQILEVSGQK